MRHHPGYLLTLFAVPLLTFGQCGNAIGTLSPNVKAQLEKLKQEALEELPISAGYRTEYDLWKYNKSFVGAWQQGDRIFLSFLIDGINYQLIESSINEAKVIFKEKK